MEFLSGSNSVPQFAPPRERGEEGESGQWMYRIDSRLPCPLCSSLQMHALSTAQCSDIAPTCIVF